MEEILKYGLEVFNGEQEKFQRWFNKYNLSLNGIPADLCKSPQGIEAVRQCLNRIEYGNF